MGRTLTGLEVRMQIKKPTFQGSKLEPQ